MKNGTDKNKKTRLERRTLKDFEFLAARDQTEEGLVVILDFNGVYFSYW